MSKQYGLIVPNKNKIQPVRTLKPAIFDDDSDSDSGFAKPTGLNKALKRQDRILQEKAIEEDPTVFQYDELFDDMDAKRKESKLARKDVDKKPKYISKLLASAEKRKLENERRIERQVQKERETEGEEFKDKESFVTSSYRAKLEEMKKLEEEEKRQEYLEAIGDVTKQGNLDGFYRHLYDQKGLYERVTEKPKEIEKPEEVETSKEPAKETKSKKGKLGLNKRKYRKKDESSESETDIKQEAPDKNLQQHLPSNIDADSDFSIDSSDSDDEKGVEKAKKPVIDIKTEPGIEDNSVKAAGTSPAETTKECSVKEPPEVVPVEEEKKPKIDIWNKRTVGEVFDEALRRYFERKSLRESGMYIRPV